MSTPLTTPANLKTILNIPAGDTSQDALLNLYVAELTTAICTWTHRKDFGLAQYTRVLSGNNTAALTLPDLPVQGLTLTGNTVSGSATITGLPTTNTPNANNLFLYQSVFGPGIPQGAIISDASQLASGQITISTNNAGTLTAAPATATASGVSLQFGIALWADNNALGGSAYGSFALGTLLQEGQDYYLDYDGSGPSQCSSGIVYRAGYYWFRPAAWFYDLVTPQVGPPIKNYRVQYCGGYTSIPLDVQAAAELIAARCRVVRKWGAGVNSMGNAQQSISLAPGGKLDVGLFTPEVRALLAGYCLPQLPGA